MKVFEKDYSSEELCDLGRDIYEAFNEQFNPVMADIPKDGYNFHRGSFTVRIVWEGE